MIPFSFLSSGIRGTVLNWFEQCVSFNRANSSYLSVFCGAPQGSVLGPLLFLIYSMIYPVILKTSLLLIFVGDTNIFCEAESLDQLQNVFDKELKK